MNTLFDVLEGEKRKDQGIQKVADNSGDWFSLAMIQLGQTHLEGEITSEDVRKALIPSVGKPGHKNAWGALMRTARRKRILIPTGKWVKATMVKSHARMIPVYTMNINHN